MKDPVFWFMIVLLILPVIFGISYTPPGKKPNPEKRVSGDEKA